MALKPTSQLYIKGHAALRRTESDYMVAMMESVTLGDWRGIIAATAQAAKAGDPTARRFLASCPDRQTRLRRCFA